MAALRIIRFQDLPPAGQQLASIDSIFFESSATRTFASDAARSAFRERWLGRYLELDANYAYVAEDANNEVVGYVVGSLDDPALGERFADIGYFAKLAEHTRRFPAHLHINLTATARSRGIGGRLIEAFCDAAAGSGVPGVHVVTGERSRNVGFYRRAGFGDVVAFDWSGSRLLMLGRALTR